MVITTTCHNADNDGDAYQTVANGANIQAASYDSGRVAHQWLDQPLIVAVGGVWIDHA